MGNTGNRTEEERTILYRHFKQKMVTEMRQTDKAIEMYEDKFLKEKNAEVRQKILIALDVAKKHRAFLDRCRHKALLKIG